VEESEVYRGFCTCFMYSYVVCRWVKHVYTWVAEGQIMYRVYVVCRRENRCMSVGFQLVNHVSGFLGRYRYS
jgi:hypothetical protein